MAQKISQILKVQKTTYGRDLKRISCFVMLFLFFCASFSPRLSAANLPLDVVPAGGLPAPNLELLTPDGQQLQLKDVQGPLTIVHFWATWCAPCVRELPQLNQFANKYRSSGVAFVIVSLDSSERAEVVKQFYKENNIEGLPIFFAKQADVMKQAELQGLPTSLFIKNNQIISRANSDLKWDNAMGTYVEQLVIGE